MTFQRDKNWMKKSHIEEIEIIWFYEQQIIRKIAIMNLKLIKNKLYRELVLCANLFNV